MERRVLLKRGLFGGLLLTLGATALGAWPTRDVSAATKPLRVLSPRTFQILQAVCLRMVPLAAFNHTEIVHRIDEMLEHLPKEVRDDLGGGLLLIENALAGALLDARFTPFTWLDAERQDAVLRSFRDSKLSLRRSVYQALRRLSLLAYYTDSRSWPAIGYPGPRKSSVVYDDSQYGAVEPTNTALREGTP